jgi:hypothetical protein
MNRNRYNVITGLFIRYHDEQPAIASNDYVTSCDRVEVTFFTESQGLFYLMEIKSPQCRPIF